MSSQERDSECGQQLARRLVMAGAGTGTVRGMSGGAEARAGNDASRSNILESNALKPECREIRDVERENLARQRQSGNGHCLSSTLDRACSALFHW